jgi:hypothetical protein
MTVIDGENISKALHHKGIGVELENVNELNWPASGGLIDLSDSRGSTEIKIAFSSLSAVVSEERFDRVMSIEFLQNALKPDSVQRGKSND